MNQVHLALVVPVPEAESVCDLAEQFPRRRVTTGVAHITVATPFIPERELTTDVSESLSNIGQARTRFEFALTRVDSFDSGWVYLAPQDAAPFLDLTHAVCSAFPSIDLFDGAHGTIVPHLTVRQESNVAEREALVESLRGRLPIHAVANELELVRSGPDDWIRIAGFPLAADPRITSAR
jgi:2'-5' RNA ligase